MALSGGYCCAKLLANIYYIRIRFHKHLKKQQLNVIVFYLSIIYIVKFTQFLRICENILPSCGSKL